MDANGLRFWMLADANQWTLAGNPAVVQYDLERRSLRLASQRVLPRWSNRWAIQVTNPDRTQLDWFYFTVRPPVDRPVQISTLTPLTPTVSPTVQNLMITGQGFQSGMTIGLEFPDGRHTALETPPLEAAPEPTTLMLPFIFSQPGAWTIQITYPDGSQSLPFHFTVQSGETTDARITAVNPAQPIASPDPQTITVTGQGFQPGFSLTLLRPDGSQTVLSPDQLQAVTEGSFQFSVPLNGLDLEAAARSGLADSPQTLDAFGTRAYWDATARRVMATGAVDEPIAIFPTDDRPALEQAPSDLVMGYDGVLYLAVAGQVVMQDRQHRWQSVTVPAPASFTAWRLAADPSGGVWVLDRDPGDGSDRQLARVTGMPLPDRPFAAYAPGTFRPCQESPNPPRLTVLWSGSLEAGEEPVAIATSSTGRLALLSWIPNADARLRCLNPDHTWTAPLTLQGIRFPYSFTWISASRIAVRLSGVMTEAPAYDIPANALLKTPATALPVGDLYPLRNASPAPFLHSPTLPPHYPIPDGSQPLYPLSLPTFAQTGAATGRVACDSGSAQTVWHRLYLEATIPANGGIQVYLAANNDDRTPPTDWYEHRFGERFAPGDRTLPLGAWLPNPSEIPQHSGFLQCPAEKGRSGLFTVLIQRSGRRVTALQGRYLWVQVQLSGDGRTSPELAALRAYASRFSYRDRYLPSLYHETLFGEDADQLGSSTPADFLERFLANFEGVLTHLEDRIASAHLLTDPRTIPAESLDWLGSWLGVAFDPAYPSDRRRQLLQATPTLYRQRGTLVGLQRALDVATNGSVNGGEIIVLENFRLRRTFATILGADLANETDPLLQGIAASGNSFLGDSLILGDETRREFLALFGPDLPSPREERAIAAFFDQLAYRVTVLVHQEVEPQDLGLIRRIVDLETPAHVLTRVLTASHPFIIGIASLIGVDTYLRPPVLPEPARIGKSYLGGRDFLLHPASLDPRLELDP